MSSPLIFTSPIELEGLILVEENVSSIMLAFCQNEAGKEEAGGLLLGYRRGIHIHIVDATIPHSKEKRTIFGFHRKDSRHGRYAIRKWKESDELIDYVGEWHTHPETNPKPSSLDLSEWVKICDARDEPMVFIIVGDCGKFWIGAGMNKTILPISSPKPTAIGSAWTV